MGVMARLRAGRGSFPAVVCPGLLVLLLASGFPSELAGKDNFTPDSPEVRAKVLVLIKTGYACRESGDYRGSIAVETQIVALTVNRLTRGSSLAWIAHSYYKMHDEAKAVAMADYIIAEKYDTHYDYAWYLKGMCAQNRGAYEESSGYFTKVITGQPLSSRKWVLLAKLQLGKNSYFQGRYEEAGQAFAALARECEDPKLLEEIEENRAFIEGLVRGKR